MTGASGANVTQFVKLRSSMPLLSLVSAATFLAACVEVAVAPQPSAGTGGATGSGGAPGSGGTAVGDGSGGGSGTGGGSGSGGVRSPVGGMSGATSDAGGGGARDAGAGGSGQTGPDAILGDAAGRDAAPGDLAGPDGDDPLNAAATCSSGKTWRSGTDQNMRPGESCPTCHANFNLAGTVYPSGHEPDDCNGVDGISAGVTIVVTDATNRMITLYPNSVGNFYTSISVATPYTAKVVVGGKERAMGVTQTSQSCNGCHTQDGSQNAPGRITLPF